MSGSLNRGCLLGSAVQSKFPPSTKQPPITVPCPPINLVKEWTTTAAPCSNGLQITGDAVLSIIKGILCFLPISETSFIGNTLK